MRTIAISVAWLICFVCSSLGDDTKDDGFVPLIRGTDLAQFDIVGLERTSISLTDGELRVAGKSQGYFATKQSYKNYRLQFDWRYELHGGKATDGNSGLLVHIVGPDQVWPKGIEVQIWYKDFGSFFTFQGAKFRPVKDDRAARDRVLKPLGEWNRQEVECRDGRITLRVNGVEYAAGEAADPAAGRIGWMAEGSAIAFRNLQIKTLD